MNKETAFDITGLVAALAVIVLPFAAFIVSGQANASSPQALSVIVGAWSIYFAVSILRERAPINRYLASHPAQRRQVYTVQVLMLLIMGYFAGPSILWVAGMPVIGTARLELSKWVRRLVYFWVAIAGALPYWVVGDFEDGLQSLTFITPAIIFVIYFSEVTLKARQDQLRAEKLTVELEAANQKLAKYAIQAEELATTQERNRIAREIHDNLGHYLTVVNVQLEAAKSIMPTQPEKALGAVEKAQRLTQEGLQAVRGSVSALRTGPVENRPISEAIAELIAENEAAGIKTKYTVAHQPHDLSPNVALTLYRVVQEALTNVRKHADATEVDVALDYGDAQAVRVTIEDNGNGSAETETGFGLLGIRERVALLGGRLDVHTAPGEGFVLAVTVPVQ